MGFFHTAQRSAAAPTASARTKGGSRVAGTPSARAVGQKQTVIPLRVQGRTIYAGGCKVCTLDKEGAQLQHAKMQPTGSEDPVLYILGEAPGQEEDKYGEQFIGRSGELIRERIPAALEDYVRWSNTVKCRPPGNRTPTPLEIAACSNYTEEDILATRPAVVMGFGMVPLKWALDQDNITDWRGKLIPMRIQDLVCWYAPLWHPAYMLRMKNKDKVGPAMYETFLRDMDNVFDTIMSGELEPPDVPEGEALSAGMHWELSWKVSEVEDFLHHMAQQGEDQAFDIETNGLRPYAADSKILTMSVGTWDLSYAVPISHREAKWTKAQRKQVLGLFGEYLRQQDKRFWCHALKFELEWIGMPWALGRDIMFEVNWEDTMAQAAVLHTATLSANSLDSRCIAAFGVPEKTLDAMDRARLDFEPLAKVLRYNARDTKFTDLLRQKQQRMIEREGLEAGYRLMADRQAPVALAQQLGVVPDTKFAGAQHRQLKAKIDAIEKQIQELPAVRQMVAEKGTPFNSGSAPQLVELLKDRLKLREGWRGEGNDRKYSTDEDVLEAIKHPIGKLILEKRRLIKLDGTYVIGLCDPKDFPDEKAAGKLIWADGLVHTNYNTLKVDTGRTSSDDPNLQNFPSRVNREIRNAIMAAFGFIMTSIDYGQIEARVIGMASECPVLCSALWDHYDIHGAWGSTLWHFIEDKYLSEAKGDEAKARKNWRKDIKNGWTFPLFFGSELGGVAAGLGIDQRRLRPFYDDFWTQFRAVKQWQDRLLKFYKKHGYVSTLTGRRRYAPMTLNQLINSPIQGTASDIVVDGMVRLGEHAHETKAWHRAPRMNVHDDLTFYLPKESIEEDLGIIVPIMCQPRFDFINVPITVEISVGESWGALEELATVESTEYGYPQVQR